MVELLSRELGVRGALAQVLVRRGLADPGRASAFLAASEEHAPGAFAGIQQAVALIDEHVRERRRITVHGDYDVDGVCSTAVLVRALRRLGAEVDWFLPDRAGDGYGLSGETVRRLAARGTRLLVTADCAITAVQEVAAARALGMQVVVTDHHAARADGALPHAPIVHPRLCGYPCADLCATAVAYKLAGALWQARGRDPRELGEDLDLVALATVADVVPLLGENRSLVRRGLQALAATRKPGLRALMSVAGVACGTIGERALGFALAPRLNAAGRLARADAALELILAESPVRAAEVAAELDRVNAERRQVERRIMFEAEAQLRAHGPRSAYVLAAEGWHAGVIGIVASRLSERLHRPVVLIALAGARGRGSGRSIEGFDLLAGLSACSQHLLRYGGHRAAAGVEIESSSVATFAAALQLHAERALAGHDGLAVERVDALVGGDELDMRLAEELQSLAPFGCANPSISLMVRDAIFRNCRPMGEGRHARFEVQSRGARTRAVAFGGGGRLPVEEGVAVQATFSLEVNEWGGVAEPRLRLRHACPAPGEQLRLHAPAPGRVRDSARSRDDAAAAARPRGASRRNGATPAGASDPEELVLFAL
jgi:single-stranded-DNA-specific exonuclease